MNEKENVLLEAALYVLNGRHHATAEAWAGLEAAVDSYRCTASGEGWECGHLPVDHVVITADNAAFRDREHVGETTCYRCYARGNGPDLHKYEVK